MSDVIPEGWEVTKLGEHTNRFYQGINTVADKVEYQTDGIPILQAKHITSGVITFSGAKFLGESVYTKYKNKFQPKDNDILFTNIGTIGKSVLVTNPSDYLIAWNVFLMGLKVDVEPKFFNLFLQKLDSDRYFEDLMTGNATKFINKTNLYDIPFLTPPLPEQKKIASIITSVDEVIENTQKQIDKLQDLKKATMNELLTKGIGHTEFKDSELGRIPKSWEITKISDVRDTADRYSFTGGPFGSNLKREDYTEKGVRIIQLQNIGDGQFLDKYKIYTSEEKADDLFSCNIYPGDIILSKMGDPVARATLIPDFDARYLMASDGIRLSINKEKYSCKFILESINHHTFRNQAELSSTGSTRKRIGLVELRTLIIPCPILAEQKEIASILASIDKTIEEKQSKLSQIQSLKKSLMQDLLTGKVRVMVN